jgi:hypothetical protein
MNYIKLVIVLGIICMGTMAMYTGYGKEVFWMTTVALSGLGGYEMHKRVNTDKWL